MKNSLLLGNGIDRAYDKRAVSWTALLEKMTTNTEMPKHEAFPFPLEVVLRTNDHVDEELAKHKKELYGSVEDAQLRCVLAKVLKMGFDEILTTNYDYALEGTAIYPKKVTDHWLKKSMKHTCEAKQAESVYLLHTYQEAEMDGVTNRIWHIHGDARRPGSIVIGHYMYVNLVSKWREKLRDRAENYRTWSEVRLEEPSRCWLDSFVLGNVYILGLGMDFCEFDLWWLLNRKKREKALHGKVVFYEPERPEDAAKYALLRAYSVEVRHLGFKLLASMENEACDEDLQAERDEQNRRIWEFNSKIYADFYGYAIEDIEREMKTPVT